jgi:hypothetical protein
VNYRCGTIRLAFMPTDKFIEAKSPEATTPKIELASGLSVPSELGSPEPDFKRKMVADFYQMNIPRLLADRRYSGALRTLERRRTEALRRAEKSGKGPLSWIAAKTGEERQDCERMMESLMDLVTFVTAVGVTKSATKSTDERLWSVGTGKTWKALREFPQRLLNVAREIEQLNQSPMFFPDKAITAKTPSANYARIQFGRLPGILRMYGTWVEVWTSKIPAVMGELLGRRSRGKADALVAVSNLIAIVTGRFNDNDTAELLNAADLVLNPTSGRDEPRFHPQTLADLRSRLKRKTNKT